MNKELMESMNILEKEYNISKDTLLEAIENSLLTACKNHFGKADNVKVIIDPDGCDYSVYMEKEVVETVEDPITQISLADARMIAPRHVPVKRVAVQGERGRYGYCPALYWPQCQRRSRKDRCDPSGS